jgi:hypothetical protein
LRIVTDPIVKIPWFAKFVKAYPLGNSLEKKLLDWDGNIKSNYDPDDVISFIRMVHQDFISGKVNKYFISIISGWIIHNVGLK